MAKIFMDVGGHLGETAQIVLDPKWGFDRVCLFEPSEKCRSALTQLARLNERLELAFFGLAGTERNAELYDSGSLAASTLNPTPSKPEVQYNSETVLLRDIFAWLKRETKEDDMIVLKLNCEGGEVEILNRLLETRTLGYFYIILITFDIREFPGGISQELRLRRFLKSIERPNFCFSDDIMIGPTHKDRIENWLYKFGVNESGLTKDELYRKFEAVFSVYANKSGRLPRFESTFKRVVGFKNFPGRVKGVFRYVKRLFRLNRERLD